VNGVLNEKSTGPKVPETPNFVKQVSLMLTVVLKYINLRVGLHVSYLL